MHFSSKPGVCAQLPAQAPHLEVTSDVFHTHQHQMHLSDQPCEKWHTAASKTAEQLLLQQQQLHTKCLLYSLHSCQRTLSQHCTAKHAWQEALLK